MRILLVNHTFPPASFAGSEICVLNQAKELQRRGHDVAVFYRIHDPSREEYSIERSLYEDVPVFILNHTYRYVRTFQEIYVNSAIAIRFDHILRQWKPDAVHFHHLTNLSLSMIDEVKANKIPAVMTLHDYWLLCQRGQLLKRDLQLCTGPSLEACRTCLAPQLLRGRLQRLAAGFIQRRKTRAHSTGNFLDLLDLRQARIQTPDKQFVQQTSFDQGSPPGTTLQAHPPSEIRYPVHFEHPAILETSIGMHPSTYNGEGYGVCFQVERNGEILFSRTLNPKQNPEHHGWHPVEIELEPSGDDRDVLILRTLPETVNDNRFCTAGWLRPRIRLLENTPPSGYVDFERRQQIRSLLHDAAELITSAFAAFSQTANEGIQHRRNWVQKVLDQVDVFISPSRFLRDYFIEHGVPENKILFLDNGFKPIPLALKKEISKATHHPIRFGYIGTWIPSKGIDLALRAFQTIDPLKAVLTVHGFFPGFDGFENYESYLKSLSSPAVHWGEKYNPEEIYSLLNKIDCLIMPSIWWENSPLTMHEAFLARVPIITADAGGMAEQVRAGGGLTFRHRNPESLRDCIQRIIDKPDLLDDLRQSIPSVQSMTGHTGRLEKIYQNISG